MSRGKLGSDTGLVHGHNRVAEADDVDAFVHQSLGHCSSFLGVADHNWCNGTIVVAGNVEASCLNTLAEVGRVGLELVK